MSDRSYSSWADYEKEHGQQVSGTDEANSSRGSFDDSPSVSNRGSSHSGSNSSYDGLGRGCLFVLLIVGVIGFIVLMTHFVTTPTQSNVIPVQQKNDAVKEIGGTNYEGAYLRNENYEGANLRNWNFKEADLQEANFRKADLRGVNFLGADLRGANFIGADLRGANLDNTNFEGAKYSIGNTYWPDNFDPKKVGAIDMFIEIIK